MHLTGESRRPELVDDARHCRVAPVSVVVDLSISVSDWGMGFEFDSGVGAGELPVGAAFGLVAIGLPGCDLLIHGFFRRVVTRYKKTIKNFAHSMECVLTCNLRCKLAKIAFAIKPLFTKPSSVFVGESVPDHSIPELIVSLLKS